MYLNIGPMRWFLTIALTIFFSPSSNAEIFDLKATVSTSTNVVTIKILGAHLTDSLLEKEGDSPGIFFEAVVLDSFSGLTTPHEKVLILGNLPLKVGFDYLVFLETKKLTSQLEDVLGSYFDRHGFGYSYVFRFSQPFYFEIRMKISGLPDSKAEMRAIYADDRIQLPEVLPLHVTRYQICTDPDYLLVESIDETLCPTTKIVRFLEWEILSDYIRQTIGSAHGG